jgi:hypothetical protein
VVKASAIAKMKIAPGNLGIPHSVRFNAADKQFLLSLFFGSNIAAPTDSEKAPDAVALGD